MAVPSFAEMKLQFIICAKGIVMKKELIFQTLIATLMFSLFEYKAISTDSPLTNKEGLPALPSTA